MKVRIEDKNNLKFVGIKRSFTIEDGSNLKAIPLFWNEVMENDIGHQLIEASGPMGVVGISGNLNPEDMCIDYYIAVEESERSVFIFHDRIQTGNQTWAIFECIGPIPESIQKMYTYITERWLPPSKYEHAPAPELEIYYPGNPEADNYKSEIWIPVLELA